MNDMQNHAMLLRQHLMQQSNTSTLTLLAGQLGIYSNLDHVDNGTRALILFLAFIEKYGEVLEMQRVAHQELHHGS